MLENPGWYTAYTPYQAEIAQGRLEALLNFQTMVMDLTGLEIANASLLDEGTAAAEAMAMSYARARQAGEGNVLHLRRVPSADDRRREDAGARARRARSSSATGARRRSATTCSARCSSIRRPTARCTTIASSASARTRSSALVTVATDLMSLVLLTPPGEWGADVCVGNSQRFGVPLGYGGPHAAFFATKDEFKRQLPGRIIGVSRDADGKPALRMALQTREQHIRREKATSNICTAQVLLAVIAGMYAVYHGPSGSRRSRSASTSWRRRSPPGSRRSGYTLTHDDYLRHDLRRDGRAAGDATSSARRGRAASTCARSATSRVVVALDETATPADVDELLEVFAGGPRHGTDVSRRSRGDVDARYDERFARTTPFLTHPVFNSYHSETEMLRYLKRLESSDLSLTTSMIPLGSCTMKLNATAEMYPVTWPEFGKMHPFAPVEQAKGYREMFDRLEKALAEITGFAAVSLQPNAGSQGEYAGLLVIRAVPRVARRHAAQRVPDSAVGARDESGERGDGRDEGRRREERPTAGNIDMADLEAKAKANAANLAALMVTYPSTHGVFEETIADICTIVHEHGGQVYLDGANMNAMVGLARPGDIGADVCHLNLHKTFCIPHGGGGPGMGPIGVAKHLVDFLPGQSGRCRSAGRTAPARCRRRRGAARASCRSR